ALSASREGSAAETAGTQAANAKNNATAIEIGRARHAVPLHNMVICFYLSFEAQPKNPSGGMFYFAQDDKPSCFSL
ncbi:MAG TPA: hypothetical protein VGH16_11225, partial [Candidatus Binatia bacterium]